MPTIAEPLCRNSACGCHVAVANIYCAMCKEYTPICPYCNAVYGEHRLNCVVPDNYNDSGEGPWDTQEEAKTFADAEVGLSFDVVCGGGKWFVLIKEEE